MPLKSDHIPASAVVPIVHLLVPENGLFAALAEQQVSSRSAKMYVEKEERTVDRASLAIGDLNLVPTQVCLDILYLLLRLRIQGQGTEGEECDEQRQEYYACPSQLHAIPPYIVMPPDPYQLLSDKYKCSKNMPTCKLKLT